MKYCKNYCEEKGISTSKLNEAQKTLYYIAENMRMDKSISEDGYKHFQHAIRALEREPCEDCISREKVLMEIDKYMCGVPFDKRLDEVIKELPSVTPQPKMGKWEWVQYDGNPNIGNWHCSECRTIIPHMPEETDNTPIYKFCPNCGAKMEVKAKDESCD